MPPPVAEMPFVPIELAIRSHSDLSLFYDTEPIAIATPNSTPK
jgi:hypothetical protein